MKGGYLTFLMSKEGPRLTHYGAVLFMSMIYDNSLHLLKMSFQNSVPKKTM